MTSTRARVFVFVEGGGDTADLKSELRRAFAGFFAKSPLGSKRRPRVVACGGRANTLDSFKTAVAEGKVALLLVDSEDAVELKLQTPPNHPEHWQPWEHLRRRDGWEQPVDSTQRDCHLMTQCMESWLIADWKSVASYFGQGFALKHKPGGSIEEVQKAQVYATLEQASKDCKAGGGYRKGRDSFELLSRVDPQVVCSASPWAQRFIDELMVRKP